MKPVEFVGQTVLLGPPPGTPRGECGALPVRRLKHEVFGYEMLSYWKPTPEELAALAAGAHVRLSVQGGELLGVGRRRARPGAALMRALAGPARSMWNPKARTAPLGLTAPARRIAPDPRKSGGRAIRYVASYGLGWPCPPCLGRDPCKDPVKSKRRAFWRGRRAEPRSPGNPVFGISGVR